MHLIGLYLSKENIPMELSRYVKEVYSEVKTHFVSWVKSLGYEFIPLIWVPKAHDHRLGVVNLWGERTLFAFNNSGCINNPHIRHRVKEVMESIVNELDVKAVILDALRFPSPHDGKSLFSCFCEFCYRKAREIGIDLDDVMRGLKVMIKNLSKYPHIDPRIMRSIILWIELRQESVKSFLIELRDKSNDLRIELRAAVFPPSISWIVGQNYDILTRYLDELHVMIYHKCRGAACLNHELASLMKLMMNIGDINEHIAKFVASIMTGINVSNNVSRLEELGIDIATALFEVERSRSIIGDKMVPILWLDEKTMKLFRELKGFTKIAFFVPSVHN